MQELTPVASSSPQHRPTDEDSMCVSLWVQVEERFMNQCQDSMEHMSWFRGAGNTPAGN